MTNTPQDYDEWANPDNIDLAKSYAEGFGSKEVDEKTDDGVLTTEIDALNRIHARLAQSRLNSEDYSTVSRLIIREKEVLVSRLLDGSDVQSPESMLLDLLAIIHRDGGHYTGEHGLEKSWEDAIQLSSERINRSEEQDNTAIEYDNDTNFVQQLKDRGWSEDSIAGVIGSTRPVVHNYLLENSAERLSREQFTRLDVLTHSHLTYKAFVNNAIKIYSWEMIYRPAYEHLAQDRLGAI